MKDKGRRDYTLNPTPRGPTNGVQFTWLKRHPRFHLHFTPTSASWINLVERFSGLITSDAIRRGVFRSVAELKTAIEAYLKQHNIQPKPFVWTASATDILEKVARGRQVLESLH